MKVDPTAAVLPPCKQKSGERAQLQYFRRFSKSQGRAKNAGQTTATGTWLLNVGNHNLKAAIFFQNYWLELKFFQVFLSD